MKSCAKQLLNTSDYKVLNRRKISRLCLVSLLLFRVLRFVPMDSDSLHSDYFCRYCTVSADGLQLMTKL